MDNSPADSKDIWNLAEALKWEKFVDHTEIHGSLALGYCHHPQRKEKAGIYIDGDLMVLADIRIYNDKQLQETFEYTSPQEVFAKAYRRWGADCANHINGDFAVVVIDLKKNEVLLFRDHIGTRPLVYWHAGSQLIFASHEFGLAKSGLFPLSLSERKLIDRYLRFRNLYCETFFQNVLKVLPGHWVRYTADGHSKSTPYWNPEKIPKNKTISFEVAVSHLRELIVNATLRRMEPCKIGLHVSGGLDSCGVSSIVADHTSDKSMLVGYSWTPEIFEDTPEGVNEREFIDAFSADKKVLVKYLKLDDYETVKNAILPEFENQHIEHPVMQMAGGEGVEILFSGWGGDEFVSLSTRGTFNHLFFRFKWGTLLKYIRRIGVKSSICKFRMDVLTLLIPFGLIPVYRAEYTDWSVLRLLKLSFIRKHWKQLFFHRRKNIFSYGNRTRFAINLLELYHLPERMDSWDINAERYGFEYKYPLLDKDVLEFWFSIPVEYTYKDFQSRLLYREAMKGILTEKIRIRGEKGEALRIAFSHRERINGKNYLENLFYSLKHNDHLPFFKPESFKKVFNQTNKNLSLKNYRNMDKYTLYLRYVALVKKYIPTKDLTNTR